MTTIYLIEDDYFQRKMIQSMIADYIETKKLTLELAKNISEPDDVISHLMTNKLPNIYFIDIDLKKIVSGIYYAKKIRSIDKQGCIIFVTAYENKLLEITNKNITPFAYIIKNADSKKMCNEISLTLNKALNFLNLSSQHKIFEYSSVAKTIRLPYDKILYFESIPRAKKVLLESYVDTYEINLYLADLKKIFKEEKNFIILKSYIINLNLIEVIDSQKNLIKFKNGSSIYFGTKIIKKILKAYNL
ncbi:TPA: LytR/AlgR family response regulator transcription factor [Enterococcus faecalis]